MKIIKKINNLMILKCLVLHCGYMSSNSRWFLDSQHSSSFKAEHEEKIRDLHYNIKFYKTVKYKKLLNNY